MIRYLVGYSNNIKYVHFLRQYLFEFNLLKFGKRVNDVPMIGGCVYIRIIHHALAPTGD